MESSLSSGLAIVGYGTAEDFVVYYLGHGRINPAQWTLGILWYSHLSKVHAQGVDQQTVGGQGLADSQEEFQSLHCLNATDYACKRSKNPSLGTVGHHPGGGGDGKRHR